MPDSFEIASLLVLAMAVNVVAIIHLIASHAARRDTERQLAAAFRLVAMLEALTCEEDDLFREER